VVITFYQPPGDLIYDTTPPIFKLIRYIIKLNILSKNDEDLVKSVA